ncbi:hypothetical protein CV549_00810 [Campylobacter jejuni]|uniref:Uncharacterized protein n=14 Tax=Campylobacteraceae TaxID=72294 RepID=A0A2R4D5U3_CAMJU|nr:MULTISPECIES: hypothetical protein [Campylobacter]AHN82824.1 hypothetical protein 00-0949_00026 [Campylobacter phage CJIE4-1]AHN82882.1 hypothetical protein 00-1597_00024 [Campylobacter phage CJIE4-2]APA81540.1 Hypothetical protein CJD42_6160 [Campylobacter jejuni subsp. jejuni D42a]EAI7420634.1 hypothetical protein [Campylobacter hyointestinalis]EFV06420.1 hypothetical protein CSQ_1388 [Campylobacter jejuni subsp. jejuni DFVF1099]UWJ04554.1 hypothetical protein KJILBIEH_00055 [Campylobact
MQLSLFDENNLKDLGIQSIKAYEEKNEKKLKDLIFKINCVLNLDSQKDLVLQIRSIYIEIYKNFLKDEEIKNLTLGFVIKLSLIYDKSVLEELKKINISNNFLQDVLKMDLQNFSKEIKLFVKENLKNQISEKHIEIKQLKIFDLYKKIATYIYIKKFKRYGLLSYIQKNTQDDKLKNQTYDLMNAFRFYLNDFFENFDMSRGLKE